MNGHATLNRFYRLIWSQLRQTWVVASEAAKGQGKGTRAVRRLMAGSALLAAHAAYAGPMGGQVVTGTGTISQSGTTTTITQSSPTLSATWQGFNTAAQETVNFVQPSSSAIAVNRILDSNATQFMGKLNANGQVYLINPNGILFGAGAQVNVGGLVASTLDITDAGLAGGARTFSGSGRGSIVNRGDITTANGGYVAFIGNRVSNQGSIVSPGGAVALGAGADVTLSFAGNSLVKMQVNQNTLDNLAENGGLIRADGGAVVLSAGGRDAVLASVVNNTGIIQARTVQDVQGTIVLDGGSVGAVGNTGTLDASGKSAGQRGGIVQMLGGDVTLGTGGRIDVAGDTGGGTALVGGNFLGAGPEQNAQNATVAPGSVINADAVTSGDGGKVAIWSNGATNFAGSISARGGASAGDGGAVETSGKTLHVGTGAFVTTLSPHGTYGNWLLDPQDFTIAPAGGDISGAQITAALQNGNVTIKSSSGATAGNGDINMVGGDFIGGNDWTSGTTLTLSAYRNVNVLDYSYIDATLGTGNIVLRADNTATGVGTINLDVTVNIYGNSTGTVKFYYNPSNYSTPTDYAGMQLYGSPIIYGNFSAYMLINLVPIISTKAYDGTANAAVSSTIVRGAVPVGITVNSTGATAAFSDKNVGTNKAVVVSGVIITGSNANQYALNGLDSAVGSITKANLTLGGIAANSKTYDGTTVATLSGTAAVTALPGDVVIAGGTGVGRFSDKNAASGKAVSVSGYNLSGRDAGNYNLVMPTGLTANITRANLLIAGLTAANKTYDGSTAATLTGAATVHAIGSDVVNVAGTGTGTFADKNAGANKAVTVAGYTLGGTDAGNYTLVQPTGVTATINRANLAVTGVSAANKTYDGTTAAALSGAATVNAIGADAVSVTGSGTGTFADKNAGANKAVTVAGYTLGGADAGNYTLVQPTGVTATINRANLAVTGVSAANKTYDGTTAAALSGAATVNAIGADAVSVTGSGTGTFADKNAGVNKAVTVAGYMLGGTDAGNYTLVQPTGVNATISKANLAVTGVSAANKTYDGTTAATLTGAATVNAIGSDVVNVAGTGTGTFADKNAGANKAVTVAGYTLGGTDAGNYTLVQPTGVNATISKANLAVTGVSAANKTYDGTTAAALSGAATVNAIGADAVSVTGSGTGTFADKNAGVNKAVTVAGYTLGGTDAGNYTLVQPTGVNATISKANLAVTGVSAANKTYDGTTAATLNGAATVNAIGSDVVNVAGTGTGTFADKNAGANKAVAVAGYTLGGADAGNYTLVQPTGVNATISKANLAVTGVSAANKTYDGTTAAALSGAATVNAIGADAVSVTGSGTGTFADKNAGVNKAVTVAGYTLGGADAGNYTLVQPTGVTATINRANLAVTGVAAANKTYDGTTAASLGGVATVAALGSDVVNVAGTGTGTFADKNAGANKAVAVAGYTLGGADAGNYTLVQPTGVTATINRANLAVTGVSAANKTYDGTTAATLNGAATVNAIGSDVVNVAGTGTGVFADKNAGANKAVTVAGYTLGGADAGNYTLVQPTGVTATINRANLAVTGVAAANKTYDGTTAASLGGVATVAALGSDVVNVAGTGTGTFADKNAGANKAVAVAGYTLGGADAGNYTLVQPTGVTATINRANLAVTGVSAANKTYDGTTAAALSGAATVNAIGADAVSVTGSGTGTFADKNAGVNKAVTVAGYTLGGTDAGNYTLVQPTGVNATISKANLAVTGVSAANKTYDGTTAATLTGAATVNAIGSDVVNVAGTGTGTFADKNAGANKAVTVAGYTLGGTDAGNYTLVQPTGVNATISKANLAVTGVSAANKTYDGTTAATLTGAATVNAIGSDVVNVAGTGTGTFADKNAGANKAVTVAGYTLGGTDAGNYTLVQPTGVNATISKANLAVTGVSAANKTYDGTTAAALSGAATVNAIGADAVSVTGSGTGTFADKNAGVNKAVTVAGYTLGGTDAGNYTLVQPTGVNATISKANLAVTGVSAANKTYDGTTAATLNGAATVNAIGSDVVNVAGTGTGTFADKNAGANKAVAVAGYTLGGADAGNYTLVQPTGVNATISKANLAVTGVSAANKTYDGTTAAALSGAATVNAIGSDVVNVAGTGTGTFADKNAGANKAVTVAGYTLGGTDAGNYTLVQPTGVNATISKANLAVTGVSAANKTYDGTTAASLGGVATVAALGSDVVNVAGTGTGTFADKNAGVNKAVTVAGYTLGGTDAGNYTLVQPTGVNATISKANLAVTGVSAANKTYDGTTAATLNGAATVNAIGSDVVNVAGTGTGTFADKNAGANKAVTVAGYTLGGTDAGNYTLVQPTGVNATISKANLAVTGVSAANKTYDGTTAASLGGVATVAALGSDVVNVAGTGTGTFADKNAGANKAVAVAGYTLGGADAGNYTLVQPTGVTATINRANLAVTGVSAANKTYDGTTAAALSGAATVNAIGSDVVNVAGTGTGTFADKNAGANKAVAVAGYTLGGADAGNYTLVQPTGVTATINRANLAVTGVSAVNKTYDGTTAASLGGVAAVAALGSDVVNVAGTGTGVFSDKNAGANKVVTVAGYTLGGADAGNYTLVQPTGVTATIDRANLAVTGVSAANKTYDGTTAASLGGVATVAALGSDVVNVAGTGTGTFADKNAGDNKAVTVAGYTLGGADAGNYTLVQPTGVNATISKANLAVTGVAAADKTYDGTTAATLNGAATVNAIGSDVVNVAGTGTGTFADKNAGAGKAVTLSGYQLAGADAGNYNLVDTGGLSATIDKANLTVAGVRVLDKTYDGTVAATLAGTATVTAIGADAVGVTGTGTARFADKNAGAGKVVTVSGYRLTGADAQNYSLVPLQGLTGRISPATLTIGGITAGDKTFDGSTLATIDSSRATLSGLVAPDAVTLSASGAFADASVGTNKTVNLTTRLGGSDAANYLVVPQTTARASITAQAVGTAVPASPETPAVPTAQPATAATPPIPAASQVQDAVAQIQLVTQPRQSAVQSQPLDASTTVVVADDGTEGRTRPVARSAPALNTTIGSGTQPPVLSIQSGGVRLPSVAAILTE